MTQRRIIFAGTPAFAIPTLEAILESGHEVLAVLTQPDRPAGRGRKLTASPVKQLAEDHRLPVKQPADLGDAATVEDLLALDAEVLVVVAYGLIVPQPLLAGPRFGALNVHASLLPRWRGAAPIQRAIEAGDTETGVSIMRMDEGLDTGNVLIQEKIPIEADATAGDLHALLAPLGAKLMLAVLADTPHLAAAGEQQQEAAATHAAKLSKTEAALDWRLPAAALVRKIHAFNPWPVATAEVNGQKIRLLRAEAKSADAKAPPGTVLAETDSGIEVATTAGVLRLVSLQWPGSRPMSAAEFLRGRSLAGQRLQ